MQGRNPSSRGWASLWRLRLSLVFAVLAIAVGVYVVCRALGGGDPAGRSRPAAGKGEPARTPQAALLEIRVKLDPNSDKAPRAAAYDVAGTSVRVGDDKRLRQLIRAAQARAAAAKRGPLGVRIVADQAAPWRDVGPTVRAPGACGVRKVTLASLAPDKAGGAEARARRSVSVTLTLPKGPSPMPVCIAIYHSPDRMRPNYVVRGRPLPIDSDAELRRYMTTRKDQHGQALPVLMQPKDSVPVEFVVGATAAAQAAGYTDIGYFPEHVLFLGGAASGLALELNLDKEAYDTSEAINATLTLRNTGEEEIVIPMGQDKHAKDYFFDFVFLGSWGHDEVEKSTRKSSLRPGYWSPPYGGIHLVRLLPGKTHTVTVRDVLPLRSTWAGYMRQHYKVAAVYRSYGVGYSMSPHTPETRTKNVWDGMIISNWTKINRIEMDPNHPYLDPNFPILLDANDPRLKGDRREPSREQRKKRTSTQGARE